MRQKTDFYSGITNTGKVRENNEDAFLVERILDDRFILACVIDGVGGYEGGEVAAQIARESILEHLQKPSEDLSIAVREAVVIANERIYGEKIASDRNTRMACVLTIAVVDLTYNQFYYAHVGDTRLYLLRDFTLVKITRDDSFVGFLEDNKRLSEEEAMKHPKRNEISKALGFDPNIGLISDYIETGISPFLPGDILLLCSDGLTDMVDSKTIASILTSKQKIPDKAKALIDAANNAGGKDNITVVLLHNTNKRTVLKVTPPPVIKKNEVLGANEEEPEDTGDTDNIVSPRGNRGWIILLVLLCLGLLGAVIWLLSTNRSNLVPQPTMTQKLKSATELRLQAMINDSSQVSLNDPAFGQFISVSDTIDIVRDSLWINGHNMMLQGDGEQQSAAFNISPTCQYVLFENIVLKNFEKAIIAQNKAVHLRNVRFENCKVSLEQQHRFGNDSTVNAIMTDSSLLRTDSLPN